MTAWETLAPDATFSGKTLTQFKAIVKAILDQKDKVAALAAERNDACGTLGDSIDDNHALALLIVNGVKGDPNYGVNSTLYSGMGYVRQSERKSGLTRKSANAAAIKNQTK